MLWNKNWDKQEVKADPHSVEALIDWLELQNPSARYNWHDCDGGCLIGLYTKSIGINFSLCHSAWFDRGDDLRVAATEPWTFGAALSRARALKSRE